MKDTAKVLLNDLMKQMKSRQILFDISDLPLNTATEINIARRRLEDLLSKTDEIQYAKEQCNQMARNCRLYGIVDQRWWEAYI